MPIAAMRRSFWRIPASTMPKREPTMRQSARKTSTPIERQMK
jgi:hypothetical protein